MGSDDKVIFLVSRDGYIDSVIRQFYASNEEEVKKIIEVFRLEQLGDLTRNISVDFDSMDVRFESKYEFDDDEFWEAYTYKLIRLELP